MKDLEPIKQDLKGKKHFLELLIEQGEGTTLDFKFEISNASKIARSLVAFANTEGGKLLVGVKDNGVIAGIRSDEEYYMVQAAAEMYSKPKIAFVAKTWQVAGRVILEVTIPKSKTIPHFAKDDQKKWKAWIRVNDQNILANDIVIEIWNLTKNKKGIFLHYDRHEKELLQYLNKNKVISFHDYCKIAMIQHHEGVKIIGRLAVLKIIDVNFLETETFIKLNSNFNLEEFEQNF